MKRMKIALSILSLICMACPPPEYPVLFRDNGQWQKSLTIKEDSIKVHVMGDIGLSGWSDNLFIEVEIAGLDNSEIAFIDTTNFSGNAVRRTHYFDDKLIFESSTFRPWPIWVYIKKNRVNVTTGGIFDNHSLYHDMTREEFMSYLDTLTARIRIEDIFFESKLIEVKVDKELLARKLRK